MAGTRVWLTLSDKELSWLRRIYAGERSDSLRVRRAISDLKAKAVPREELTELWELKAMLEQKPAADTLAVMKEFKNWLGKRENFVLESFDPNARKSLGTVSLYGIISAFLQESGA